MRVLHTVSTLKLICFVSGSFPGWIINLPSEMCWPVKSQLWVPQRPTQTGSFPAKLNTQGNEPRLAASNRRMLDHWAWRLVAERVRLKYSHTKAAAKVNRSRPLSRPPSNTSLCSSCYHLAEKKETRQHSSPQNVYGTCEIDINTHILWPQPHLKLLPPPSVNRASCYADIVSVMTSEYCFAALNICTLWLCCRNCFAYNQESGKFFEWQFTVLAQRQCSVMTIYSKGSPSTHAHTRPHTHAHSQLC